MPVLTSKQREDLLPNAKVSYGMAVLNKETHETTISTRRFNKPLLDFPEEFKLMLIKNMFRLQVERLDFTYAVDTFEGKIYEVLALAHPRDPFCYKVGRQIVLGRLLRLEGRLSRGKSKDPKKLSLTRDSYDLEKIDWALISEVEE